MLDMLALTMRPSAIVMHILFRFDQIPLVYVLNFLALHDCQIFLDDLRGKFLVGVLFWLTEYL